MTISLRNAGKQHLEAVIDIERVSFGDPWIRRMFAVHLEPDEGNVFLVAEDEGIAIGYAITKTVAGESELLNIAVAPVRRGEGLGARLLDEMMVACAGAGALEMWLEVRASNERARALYDSRGFVQMGVRKRYYHAPREDAIVLRADLLADAGNKTITRAAFGFSAGALDPIPSPARHTHRQETK
jgi:ribosomal-protein-alanine N-acetyltransferase